MTTEALTIHEPQETAIAEVVSVPESPALLPSSIINDPYTGIAAMPFDAKAQKVLADRQQVPDEWIDIRPEGLIYLSHMKARAILNEAFGFGGWAIVPIGEFRREEKDKHILIYRTFRLYVAGRFCGEVEAAGDYWTNNNEQNYADAAEACQSYALNRLCKNFGIASQCWDKAYGEQWKAKYAETYQDNNGKTRWRKRKAGKTSQPHVEPPPVQPEREDAEKTADAPNGAVVIYVASLGKEWTARGRQCRIVNDTAGQRWTFDGPALIAMAETALESKQPLEIEYAANGKYRNVHKALWPETKQN